VPSFCFTLFCNLPLFLSACGWINDVVCRVFVFCVFWVFVVASFLHQCCCIAYFIHARNGTDFDVLIWCGCCSSIEPLCQFVFFFFVVVLRICQCASVHCPACVERGLPKARDCVDKAASNVLVALCCTLHHVLQHGA